MTATILDGESLAKRLTVQLAPRVAAITGERGFPPLLSIVSIGGSGASALYMRKKLDACREAGIESSVQALPVTVSESEVNKLLAELSHDSGVDGIIIETPLPKHLALSRLLDHLAPLKDIEGVTPNNYGRLFAAKSWDEVEASGALLPPTPHAILQLLAQSAATPGTPARLDPPSMRDLLKRATADAEAVVVGRSSIAGRPAAHLLSCFDATVTLCHSKSRELNGHLKRADIVVSAVGAPGLIHGEHIKRGAVVLDAGIGYEGKKISGDVDFASAQSVARCISPVPGGVGPVTVAMLLANIVATAERRLRSSR